MIPGAVKFLFKDIESVLDPLKIYLSLIGPDTNVYVLAITTLHNWPIRYFIFLYLLFFNPVTKSLLQNWPQHKRTLQLACIVLLLLHFCFIKRIDFKPPGNFSLIDLYIYCIILIGIAWWLWLLHLFFVDLFVWVLIYFSFLIQFLNWVLSVLITRIYIYVWFGFFKNCKMVVDLMSNGWDLICRKTGILDLRLDFFRHNCVKVYLWVDGWLNFMILDILIDCPKALIFWKKKNNWEKCNIVKAYFSVHLSCICLFCLKICLLIYIV